MEEQSCVLLENGRRISAFASQLPFMRGTALTPDPSIKNRQAPCGACRFLAKNRNFDRNRARGCNYGLEGGAFLIIGGCNHGFRGCITLPMGTAINRRR